LVSDFLYLSSSKLKVVSDVTWGRGGSEITFGEKCHPNLYQNFQDMMLFVGLMVAFYCDVYHKDFQI
jgi:hypothetical protein